MKKHADALFFHTAVCARAPQTALDVRLEIAYVNF